MNRTRIVPATMLLLTLGVARADEKSAPAQVEKQSKSAGLSYLLYVPKDYAKSDKPYPMLLFLHGAGERGNDLAKVKKHGPPKLIDEGKAFPFIVVSPQCPGRKWWESAALMKLVEEVQASHRVDKDRIYVTGLSMGGFGSWRLAADYPKTFAAIAPICGGGDPKSAEKLKGLPIWVFHGAKDTVVKIDRSQAMVDALKKLGHEVKFTVYPDARHDSWTATYNNPKLYEWLLEHKRKP